ncbi:hypothetical protein UFOVP728_16 [uncultured Caudovirales phage]|uniref:Uncharacterized protein n=1 Tax=uncultured Caudovirales phage TaxID=2100421 RepID=A0A6J5NLY3_9CAUD|nr:hypothetical protein UFOVP728_16 [uncultured Caudovirales phage]
MTPENIIRMAREARGGTTWWPIHVDILERFAALVAAAEREACVQVCEDWAKSGAEYALVDAIRARRR